jgi:hypothetical protein
MVPEPPVEHPDHSRVNKAVCGGSRGKYKYPCNVIFPVKMVADKLYSKDRKHLGHRDHSEERHKGRVLKNGGQNSKKKCRAQTLVKYKHGAGNIYKINAGQMPDIDKTCVVERRDSYKKNIKDKIGDCPAPVFTFS